MTPPVATTGAFTERLVGAARRRVARLFPARRYTMRNPRPLLSICFDDVPASACTTGAAILEAAGLRGTFYVCLGLSRLAESSKDIHSRDDLVRLHLSGHELGSHGYSHLNYESSSPQDIANDIRLNDEAIQLVVPNYRFSSFAFPYGGVSPSAKREVAKRFHCMRGIHGNINRNIMDVCLLKARELYQSRITRPQIDLALHQTVENNGWLIFFTHDVCESPTEVGCTPALLRYVLERALQLGIEVLPIKHALAKASFRPT